MTDTNGEVPLPPPKPASDSVPYVRLHVQPLDPDLLKVVLSSAVLPRARNISYHAIETFPEKRYGFLELPNEDAEKLRKKLNGAVLKGVKIRIERARSSNVPAPLAQAAMAWEKTSSKTADGVRAPKDKSKKRKCGPEELSGIVLEDGRQIKRGWTSVDEPKEKSKRDKEKKGKRKKKQAKSKYTDHAECLVKTVLPANLTPMADTNHSNPIKKKKCKSREVTVHEFERTNKFPTFLKASTPVGRSGASLEYVDGKGWVDEDGNVVEAVKVRPPPSAKVLLSGPPSIRDQKTTITEDGNTTNPSDDELAAESEPESPASVGTDNPASEPRDPQKLYPLSPGNFEAPRPRSSGSTRSLSIKIPPATPNEHKVHPLEALYKRPKQPDDETPNAATTAQGFSFFADGSGESAEEDVDTDPGEAPKIQVPLTPFTREDLELRGIRSAAPTPDTAHPNRKFTPWETGNDSREHGGEVPGFGDSEEEEEEEGQYPPRGEAHQGGDGEERPASDFQKWFWENRGDLNRSWKKRRKLAGKEKRYRENKARVARAI